MDEIFVAPSLLCHCKELEMYVHILIDDNFLTENSIYSNTCINNGNFESLTRPSLNHHIGMSIPAQQRLQLSSMWALRARHHTQPRALLGASRRHWPLHMGTNLLRVFYMYTLPRIYVHRHTSHMRAELHFPSLPFRSVPFLH